ncbi:Non-specific serine/threonine protein kinase [Sulfidibacter corallicola]|uniref:Serine/threonine protein kinase n=1 Tax=Sulfidibacter corallicola TaxID=2818388 RepID=A0A8A4TRQ4_SULCO|nr:serine/threonine-protein kinase [Sulfidibacter corallicola]QTD52636.1 serine/threonine protein kinase [Sulfidibacter corallicola]
MGISDAWKAAQQGDQPPNDRDGDHLSDDPGFEERGQLVGGRYVIERVLQEGGMGRIYMAHYKHTPKKVVIKTVMMEDLGPDREYLMTRFRREAKGLLQFSHPNIVEILDYNLEAETPYIVFEFIEGATLREYLEDYPQGLPVTVGLSFMAQLCGALGTIHQRGIVHRDIKPTNIMVIDDPVNPTVKILDFGLVFFEQVISETFKAKLTRKGQLVGTPAYMSPEQCVGRSVTHHSDIYNLGLIAFEMMTGRPAFESRNLQKLLLKQLKEKPAHVHLLRTEVPRHISYAINRALQKDPLQRFESTNDFWKSLRGNP